MKELKIFISYLKGSDADKEHYNLYPSKVNKPLETIIDEENSKSLIFNTESRVLLDLLKKELNLSNNNDKYNTFAISLDIKQLLNYLNNIRSVLVTNLKQEYYDIGHYMLDNNLVRISPNNIDSRTKIKQNDIILLKNNKKIVNKLFSNSENFYLVLSKNNNIEMIDYAIDKIQHLLESKKNLTYIALIKFK